MAERSSLQFFHGLSLVALMKYRGRDCANDLPMLPSSLLLSKLFLC